MDLNNYSSTFELFAGVNIALMLSDAFISTINKHFSESYTYLIYEIDEVNNLLGSVKENIKQIDEQIHLTIKSEGGGSVGQSQSVSFEEKKRRLLGEIRKYETRISEIDSELDALKKQSEISCRFKFICFYSALYCIVVLIMGGVLAHDDTSFVKDHKLYFLESLSFFSTISLLLYFMYFIKDYKGDINVINKVVSKAKKLFKDGYFRTLIHFICISVLSIGWFLYHDLYNRSFLGGPASFFITTKYLFIISIIIAAIHFPYYFVTTIWNSIKHRRKYSEKIEEVRSALEEYNNNKVIPIRTVSDFVRSDV